MLFLFFSATNYILSSDLSTEYGSLCSELYNVLNLQFHNYLIYQI